MLALYVFVGGGAGSALRWAVAEWAPQPWATVLVNLVGSFLLAVLAHPAVLSPGPVKLALCTGLLGGFTTYSTFNLEVLRALQTGRGGSAAAQIALTLIGALAAGAAGWALAEWWGRG